MESSFPTEVTRELATTGVYDFGGALKAPFSAHPHADPRTGELHGFGMQLHPGALFYHRVDAGGALVESREIAVPGATMMHDFALTENYVIFMDLPIVFDLLLGLRGKFPFRWSDKYGARLGILDRRNAAAPVRWLEIEPCYVFHVMNAVEHGSENPARRRALRGTVARRQRRLRADDAAPFHARPRRRTRERDDARRALGRVSARRRTPHRQRVSLRLRGGGEGAGDGGKELRKYDLRDGSTADHRFGPGCVPGEMVFVPAGSGEDAGG